MADQINVNAIANTLQTKVDLPDGVSQSQCDFVISRKSPTVQDPTWYRIYKSGWVEQGGQWTTASAAYNSYTVTLPIAMRDTQYYANAIISYNGGDCWGAQVNNKTTTTITFVKVYNSLGLANWEVKGYAATTKEGEGDDEATLGNVYKTYFYNGTDLDYANAVGPYTVQQMAAYSIPKSGAIVGQVDPAANTTGKLKINNKVIWGAYHYQSPVYIQVKKGDIFSYENLEAVSDLTYNSLWFVPYDESSQSTDITITTLVDAIYPVGSIYIGTTVNCPLASIVGTWTKIDEDLVLQSSSQSHQAGTTIAAGLPNITGKLEGNAGLVDSYFSGASGALYQATTSNNRKWAQSYSSSNANQAFGFDASRSNPIYGNSNTVQPPAYVVNIWKRTA